MKKMTYLLCLLLCVCSCSDSANNDLLPEDDAGKGGCE